MIREQLRNTANICCLIAVAVCATLVPSSLQAQVECSTTVELDLRDQDYDQARVPALPVSEGPFHAMGRSLVDSILEELDNPERPVTREGTGIGPPVCLLLRGRPNSMYEVGIFLLGLPTTIGPREVDFPPLLKLRITREIPVSRAIGQFSYGRSFRDTVVLQNRSDPGVFFPTEVMLDLTLFTEFLRDLRSHFHPRPGYEARYKEEAYKVLDMIYSLEFLFVARRVDDYCTLSASVTGDINQHFFGDVAYFNTSTVPVKKGMMVGSMGEIQTQEDVGGFGTVQVSEGEALSMAARLGLISEEEREEASRDDDGAEDAGDAEDTGEPDGEPQRFAEWAREELKADDPSEGDNFGLNLTDVKLDADPQKEVEDLSSTDEGPWDFAAKSGAVGGMLASAFTLTLSGRMDVNQFDADSQPDDAPTMFTVTPSTITASVGLSDKGGDRIPFEMKEGSPLVGTIEVLKGNVDFIIGSLAVELETKGVYTLEGEGAYTRDGVAYTAGGIPIRPRKLEIQVVANFAAKRGSLACGQ